MWAEMLILFIKAYEYYIWTSIIRMTEFYVLINDIIWIAKEKMLFQLMLSNISKALWHDMPFDLIHWGYILPWYSYQNCITSI
jgi:hypothetical protein